ncbi:MAG: prepilin-type N-terminal cleavage/methylation domain-containing protein [Oscillospiraceae bacterium]|nr:prepilin-type N-terminal cleavage/methylation domain-containing protein [Oscillospiraceae bacterium]
MKTILKLKRLLKKRNKSGFTLVEVVIACALLSILVLGVMNFVTPVMNRVAVARVNGRATMLAESVNSYISGMLKTAVMVEVYENTTYETAADPSTATGLKSVSPDGLHEIDEFMQEGDNMLNYEVCCIGLKWDKDNGNKGKKKLMLVSCEVENTLSAGAIPLNLTSNRKVFNTPLYEGLYPIVTLETFKAKDSSGADVSTNAFGYKVSTKVYADVKCYAAISEAERKKSKLAFEGVSYFQCMNMSNPASDTIEATTLQNAIDANKSKTVSGELNVYKEGDKEYYYPETYIYYVVHK